MAGKHRHKKKKKFTPTLLPKAKAFDAPALSDVRMPSAPAPGGLGGLLAKFFSGGSNPYALIRSDLPLHGCWIMEGWQEAGMGGVVIARRMESGNLIFACFLVDVWGFGIKDCFGNVDFPEERLQRELLQRDRQHRYVAADYALARQLVLGGERWARQHQFKLPREFKQWRKIFEPLQPGETLDLSLFGKDGEPLLIGEMDDIARRIGRGWVDVD